METERLLVAATADNHVGKNDVNREAFKTLVKHFKISKAQVIILNGDILDRRATEEDIKFVVSCVRALKEEYGKQIIFVAGNHEERLQEPPWEKTKALLQQAGAQFLEPGNQRIECTSSDGNSISFVGLPCTLPIDDMQKLKGKNLQDQVSSMHKSLEEKYLSEFERALKESEEKNMVTVVIFHAPPLLEPYGEVVAEYRKYLTNGFVNAMNPSNVLAIIHGHLHDGMFPGIEITQTDKTGIVIINDGIREEEIEIPVPFQLRELESEVENLKKSIINSRK